MKILTTGKGKSGSWQIRGEQLGGAVGLVKPNAFLADCKAADAIVVCKRPGPVIASVIASGKPWIWDLVDFYPQPTCSSWSREYAVEWARNQITALRPAGVVYATQRMMLDIGMPGIWIPHHCRPDTVINPIREKVQVVGYEGCAKYLGRWKTLLEEECARRGWQFVCNDRPVGEMDIVVAFRDAEFNGYVQRSWKSNVKLANAHGAGTPFIGPREEGYLDTATGFECWVDLPKQLSAAFDYLEPRETRQNISAEFRRNTITVQACARTLRDYVQALLQH